MLIRRNLALVLGTVALSSPALVACGFDAATDRPYTPAAGVYDQTTALDISSAVIVSTTAGSGTFVATIANEEQGEDAELTSLDPASGATIESAEFEAVPVPAGTHVDLADEGGLAVTGDFEAGDVVEITLGFASGERVTMTVPVVENAGYFAGLDGEPAPSEEPSTPTETADTETE